MTVVRYPRQRRQILFQADSSEFGIFEFLLRKNSEKKNGKKLYFYCNFVNPSAIFFIDTNSFRITYNVSFGMAFYFREKVWDDHKFVKRMYQ